jgi:hypothetical protein
MQRTIEMTRSIREYLNILGKGQAALRQQVLWIFS